MVFPDSKVARAWSLVVAVALASSITPGCMPRPEPMVPPGELTLEIHQEAERAAIQPDAPRPDVRIINARFAEQYDAYGLAVQRVLLTPVYHTSKETLGLVYGLSFVIEVIPNADGVNTSLAAARMRLLADVAARAAAGDTPTSFGEAATRALRVAVDTLHALAKGPYRGSANLERALATLDLELTRLEALGAAARPRDLLLPLRTAELALGAIANTLGRENLR